MYPLIEINLKNIIENAKEVKKLCEENEIELSIVTKLLVDNKEAVKAVVESCEVKSICESRIKNFISYKDINVEKWLIREPMLCEIEDVVKYSDASFNSEMTTIIELDKEAKRQDKVHKIILTYELGDIREGCDEQELEEIIEKSKNLKNIEIYGIATSFSCFGEIVPTEENMKQLNDTVNKLENKFKMKFKVVSGGNTSSYNILRDGTLPKTVNNLRLGEAVFLGTIISFDETIENLNQDNFKLKAQIVEIKNKSSVPIGERAKVNAFLDKTIFTDKGIRKKALIDIGKQDINVECMKPIDKEITIIGGSSDYIVLDIDDCKKQYKIGDVVEFDLNYSGILSLMASKYVYRTIK